MAQFWETGANSQNSTFQCCTLQDKLQFQIIWIWTNCCFSSDLGQIPIPKNAKFKSTNYKHLPTSLHVHYTVCTCPRVFVCDPKQQLPDNSPVPPPQHRSLRTPCCQKHQPHFE